jgi:class 3 adenylate cyclase
LLFSDIEGSTALLQRAGDRYRELLGRHDELLRATVAVSRTGFDGDRFSFVSCSRW